MEVEYDLAAVKAGIDRALERFPGIESLSIDTWGWITCLYAGITQPDTTRCKAEETVKEGREKHRSCSCVSLCLVAKYWKRN